VYRQYADGLTAVARKMGASTKPVRVHVALESASWGRPPLPPNTIDPCLNPKREEAYREANYCAARKATMNAKELALSARFFIYDPFWMTAQDIAHELSDPDGHHIAGPAINAEVLQVLHRACGDTGSTEEGQGIQDVSFSFPAEDLDGMTRRREILFPQNVDPRWQPTRICSCYGRACAQSEQVERWKAAAARHHQLRGWKRVDGKIIIVNSTDNATDTTDSSPRNPLLFEPDL
jgi:hypothetical protein